MRNLLILLLCVAASMARADITLDKKFPIGSESLARLKFINSLEDAVNRDLVADGFEARRIFPTLHFLHAVIYGNDYYITPFEYRSKEQTKQIEYEVKNKLDLPALPSGGLCAVSLYNPNIKRVAHHTILLPEENFHTFCNGIDAIATAPGMDAVLLTVSYYITGRPRAKNANEIGKGWRYITVLLKFKNDNGIIKIEQDDSCFGNPNELDTIARARKKLNTCNFN